MTIEIPPWCLISGLLCLFIFFSPLSLAHHFPRPLSVLSGIPSRSLFEIQFGLPRHAPIAGAQRAQECADAASDDENHRGLRIMGLDCNLTRTLQDSPSTYLRREGRSMVQSTRFRPWVGRTLQLNSKHSSLWFESTGPPQLHYTFLLLPLG